MPVWKKSAHIGRITYLGHVVGRDVQATLGPLASTPLAELVCTLDGPVGESHAGHTRPSCSRVSNIYPRDTTIANTRQLSILSAEELAQIAAEMGLSTLDPALVGATMVIEGVPDLSFLPPSARLQGPDGATMVVDINNRPCTLPVAPIDQAHPGHGRAFKAAAKDRRGIVGWMEREGTFRLGDALTLFIPDQRAWQG
jgi:hypothetical protein